MSEQFKTCLFGGFDKEDVVNFIEKLSAENHAQIELLNAELVALRRKNGEIEQALRDLHAKASDWQENSQAADDLRTKVADLTDRCETLEHENEQLVGPAREYLDMKDHIADIEIAAHRRTEAYRAEMLDKLRHYIDQQRSWCNEQKGRFGNMKEDAIQNFQRCSQMVENMGVGGFDTMLAQLDELEKGLE